RDGIDRARPYASPGATAMNRTGFAGEHVAWNETRSSRAWPWPWGRRAKALGARACFGCHDAWMPEPGANAGVRHKGGRRRARDSERAAGIGGRDRLRRRKAVHERGRLPHREPRSRIDHRSLSLLGARELPRPFILRMGPTTGKRNVLSGAQDLRPRTAPASRRDDRDTRSRRGRRSLRPIRSARDLERDARDWRHDHAHEVLAPELRDSELLVGIWKEPFEWERDRGVLSRRS